MEWLGLAHPAETEATCIWKINLQIVVEISKSLCYECQVRGSFCERSGEKLLKEYDSLAGQTLQQDDIEYDMKAIML